VKRSTTQPPLAVALDKFVDLTCALLYFWKADGQDKDRQKKSQCVNTAWTTQLLLPPPLPQVTVRA